MGSKVPMTALGRTKLEFELKNLKQVERPSVIKAIEVARAHGDLSENADYDAAKERQGFVEARISDIQGKIAEADVIDPSKIVSDKIIFGAYVKIVDLDSDEEASYQIVGVDEANIKEGKLSVFAPLARSLIGKMKGDVVEFKSPKGEKEYEIIDFEYK